MKRTLWISLIMLAADLFAASCRFGALGVRRRSPQP